mgnify:FL=1
MKLIFERWNKYLLLENVAYSGVVLDNESHQRLLNSVDIPEGWETIAHHMTITLGPLLHPKGKHDFSKNYGPGNEVTLKVTHVGLDDRAMAVKVEAPYEISKRIAFPHITVAVNREGGGKPFHSNKIPADNFKPIEGELMVRGTVQEVPS